MSDTPIHVQLKQKQDYQFDIHFGGDVPMVMGDEPAPLGAGQTAGSLRGNCLPTPPATERATGLALRKFKQAPEPLSCDVHAQVGRNAEGRLRVLEIRAVLTLGVPASSLEHLDRVLNTFESYCTVTQSVGQGISVVVEVVDALGQRLK